MIVRCTNCSSAYSVEDSKVEGKKFGFECPKCGTNVVIDNRIHDKSGYESANPLNGEFTDAENRSDLPSGFDAAFDGDTPFSGSADTSDFTFEDSTSASFGTEELSDGLSDAASGLSDSFDGDFPDFSKSAPDDAIPDAGFSLDDDSPTVEIPDLQADDFSDIDSAFTDSLSSENQLNTEKLSDIDFPDFSGMAENAESFSEPSVNSDDLDSAENEFSFDAAEENGLIPQGFGVDSADDDSSFEIEPEIDLSVLGNNIPAAEEEDEKISMDLDSIPFNDAAGEEDNALDSGISGTEDDDKISVDLDELDLDMDDEFDNEISSGDDEKISFDLNEIETEESPVSSSNAAGDDENITLDLDSLDLDLEESNEILSGDAPEDTTSKKEIPDDDDSLTLDLDSLDIDLEEDPGLMSGEALESADSSTRLALSDAGISFDEIEETSDPAHDQTPRLSINDIEESFEDDMSFDEIPDSEESILDSFSDESGLPSIDIDKYQDEHLYAEPAPEQDEFLDINPDFDESAYPYDPASAEESGSGYVNFSVDYTIRYSRLKAFLKLIFLYNVILIPNIFALGLYGTVSSLTMILNNFIVLFTGRAEKDYIIFSEKLLRYKNAVFAVISGIIEEIPRFTDKRNVDYPLQLSIVRAEKNSRLLAFLRITVIGILAALMPHIIILAILSFGATLFSFIGLVCVIITGRYPNFFFDYLVRYYRYYSNIAAYVSGAVDSYPTFRFD